MEKRLLIITPVVILILCLLKYMNILQDVWGSIPGMVSLSIILILLIQSVVAHNDKNAAVDAIHYDNLDSIRYIFSILVILLHLRPFLGINDQLDFVFNNIVGRICVPFFFIVTGYFIAVKEKQNPNYIKAYLRHMIPVYLLWSICYIPLGLTFIEDMNIPAYLYPLAMLIALGYTGMYYHLWYFPALFMSLLLLGKWKKIWKLKYLLILSFFLLCIGATETYFGLLPSQLQSVLSQFYFDIFFTTRNFLFFGLFYVTFGYFIGKHRLTYVSYSFLKFLLCVLLLIVEALVLQGIDRLDSNILFSCIPLVYYLFVTLIHTSKIIRFNLHYQLRELYKYYYLIHPLVIYIVMSYQNSRQIPMNYVVLIILVIVLTHVCSIAVIEIKRKFTRLPI